MKKSPKIPFVTTKQLWLAVAVVCLVLTAQSFIFLHIVTNEIPGLKKQVADRDKTIQDATYILTKQAIPGIIYLNNQVKSLGGTPPPIILNQTQPPFTPPK